MSRILITGSSDGLGRATADTLLGAGHTIIVHARNRQRSSAVSDLIDRGAELLITDLADRDAVIEAATRLEAGAPIDAVIHNAGVISGAALMPVNVVAPYLFTAVLTTPRQHVYLSSGMHRGGTPRLDRIDWAGLRATGSYSDSKLFVTALALGVDNLWAPRVRANAVDPGWVPTKMGGAGAPDDIELGHETQEKLVTGELTGAGGYWFHSRQQHPHTAATDHAFQRELLDTLASETGVPLTLR